ncbi:CidA/LrgA family protein [Thalassorhabdus alkalitolerans]|uniref:CidA/LrgA family protein n=1 Tax=Thalassorhabdus alkalitolerans TaxID=2282697 RepID=A0ABW0YN09_9BACI
MDVIRTILHIAILYGFYVLGSWIQELFNLVIPGSIIGMLLLLFLFFTKVLTPKMVERGAVSLLSHMPILFLPITIGIIEFLDVLSGGGVLLIFVALISTVIVMVVSSLVSQILAKRRERQLERMVD